MTTFTGTDFNLIKGDLISAKIRAINSIGTGQYSLVNLSGALVETVPSQLSPAPSRGSATSNSVIQVTWPS